MRVATYNILHGLPTRGRVVDPAKLIAACRGLDADVLALQEVDRHVPRSHRLDLAAEVAGALGMAHVFRATQDRDGGEYGNALLVRGTVDRAEVVALPQVADREPRNAIVAAVRVSDRPRPCSVAATHLSIRKGEGIAQLEAAVAAVGSWPEPRVLLGDLNLRTALVRPVVEAAGLTLAGGGATFPAVTPVRRIDHVAVRGFTIGEVRIVATGVSDHRALVVDLADAGAP